MIFNTKDIEKMYTSKKGIVNSKISDKKLFFTHTEEGGKYAIFESKDRKERIRITKATLQIIYEVIL